MPKSSSRSVEVTEAFTRNSLKSSTALIFCPWRTPNLFEGIQHRSYLASSCSTVNDPSPNHLTILLVSPHKQPSKFQRLTRLQEGTIICFAQTADSQAVAPILQQILIWLGTDLTLASPQRAKNQKQSCEKDLDHPKQLYLCHCVVPLKNKLHASYSCQQAVVYPMSVRVQEFLQKLCT